MNNFIRFSKTIQEFKLKIKKMIQERNFLSSRREAKPSAYWEEGLALSSYIFNLSPEDFKNIKLHTWTITGESILPYWQPYPYIDSEKFAENTGYKLLISKVPKKYWIGEVTLKKTSKQYGVKYKGKIINHDIIRFQKCISNLYNLGIINILQKRKKRKIIIDIGSGYGGLVHSLSGILNNAVYIILDLPEMLMFSATFLSTYSPNKKIYLYDNKTFTKNFIKKRLDRFDFILLPNYILDKLASLEEVDLITNLQSFQEMSSSQVKDYLKFAIGKLHGYLYSDNYDRHPYNKENVNISKILPQYFLIYPNPKTFTNLFKNINDPSIKKIYKTYVGFSNKNDSLLNKINPDNFYISSINKNGSTRYTLKPLAST